LLSQGPVGARKGTLSQPHDGVVATQPSYSTPTQSARQYNPVKQRDFGKRAIR